MDHTSLSSVTARRAAARLVSTVLINLRASLLALGLGIAKLMQTDIGFATAFCEEIPNFGVKGPY